MCNMVSRTGWVRKIEIYRGIKNFRESVPETGNLFFHRRGTILRFMSSHLSHHYWPLESPNRQSNINIKIAYGIIKSTSAKESAGRWKKIDFHFWNCKEFYKFSPSNPREVGKNVGFSSRNDLSKIREWASSRIWNTMVEMYSNYLRKLQVLVWK